MLEKKLLNSGRNTSSNTWNCTTIPNYTSLSISNFYGCSITTTVNWYNGNYATCTITSSYDASTGILTVTAGENTNGGNVYPGPSGIYIQPIIIK